MSVRSLVALLAVCALIAIALALKLEVTGTELNTLLLWNQNISIKMIPYSIEYIPFSVAVSILVCIVVAFVLVYFLASKATPEGDPARNLIQFREWRVQGPIALAVMVPVFVLLGLWLWFQYKDYHEEFRQFVRHVEQIQPVSYGMQHLPEIMSPRVRIKLSCTNKNYLVNQNIKVDVERANAIKLENGTLVEKSDPEPQPYQARGVRFSYAHPLNIQILAEEESGMATRTYAIAKFGYDRSQPIEGDPSGYLWEFELRINPLRIGEVCQSTQPRDKRLEAAAIKESEGCVEGDEVNGIKPLICQ
jgi:hypothetical protein